MSRERRWMAVGVSHPIRHLIDEYQPAWSTSVRLETACGSQVGLGVVIDESGVAWCARCLALARET